MLTFIREERVAAGIIAACFLLIAAGIVFAVPAGNAWERRCEAAGGHEVTVSATGVGVTTGGKPVVTTTYSSLCVTADGRILEVD
jgi:hypothetical protein